MRTVGDTADFAQFRMGTFSLCTNPLPVKIGKGFICLWKFHWNFYKVNSLFTA